MQRRHLQSMILIFIVQLLMESFIKLIGTQPGPTPKASHTVIGELAGGY